MEISTLQIKAYLHAKEIEYNWNDYTENTYIFCSLFSPENKGFYFYNGKKPISVEIKNSLILAQYPTCIVSDTNQYILCKNNEVQKLYYGIISSLFSRKSNGKIASTSKISSNAKIGKNVQIDDFCVIEECTIEDNVIISSHSKIHKNTTIKKNTIIESHSVIGTQGVAWVWNAAETKRIIQPQLGKTQINENCFLGANTIIVRGSLNESTTIGANTLLAPGSRIGHGTHIGQYVHFANNIVTGGNTKIGNFSFIGSSAVFRPKVKIHEHTIVGAGSVVVKNTTKPNLTLIGIPAKEHITKPNPSGMPKPKKN